MRVHYEDWKPRRSAIRTVQQAADIIDEYQRAGLTLSLRQLYYQFVSRDLCANTQKEYSRLGDVVSKARLAGLLDWDAIEDRGREPTLWADHAHIGAAVSKAVAHFRLERLQGQDTYVELWVEKDALSGVLERVASKYHVPVMVNRGYSSSSAMRASAVRFQERMVRYGSRDGVILYLGDLDPSGEDMVRDIQARINLFSRHGYVVEDDDTYEEYEDPRKIAVEKLALTIDQVDEYRPPPNPAKMSDSRAEAYVKKYGRQSWEVDALPPNVLTALIEDRLREILNINLQQEIVKEERAQRAKLVDAMKKAGITTD